jgi:hypothetical protein
MTSDDRPSNPFASTSGAPVGTPSTPPFGSPGRMSDADLGRPLAPEPAQVVATPVRRRGAGGMLINAVLGLALVVAVGGVAFAAGRATAPTTATRTGTGANGGFANGQGGFVPGGPRASGAPGFGGGGLGFGGGGAGLSIEGTVSAVGADGITLTLTSGQTVTIPTSSSTTYHQRTAGSASDVTTGSTVIVQLAGGRGAFGQGGGQGNTASPRPSGAPGAGGLGTAVAVTVVPAGS